MVENPTNQTGYGSKGELGPYQFRSSTWRMYSSKPFQMATDRDSADQVAIQHYEWIKERLTAAGIDATGYNIALAWNCGLSAVLNGRVPMQTYQYAERVNNLAQSYHRPEADAPVQVVVIPKTNSPEGAIEFKLSAPGAAPEFKIVSAPFVFRVASDSPRYFVALGQPRSALVLN